MYQRIRKSIKRAAGSKAVVGVFDLKAETEEVKHVWANQKNTAASTKQSAIGKWATSSFAAAGWRCDDRRQPRFVGDRSDRGRTGGRRR